MKILLSPAKKLDFEKQLESKDFSTPIFLDKTSKILIKLQKLKPKEIQKLMKLSPQLSELNFERFQNFDRDNNPTTAAVLAFNGEVYAGLNAKEWSEKNYDFATKTLRILSGLYGILKPKDLIQPYRLEMGTKLKIGRKNNLYEFWGDDIVNYLNQEEKEVIINLASNEYNKAAKLKNSNSLIITPSFKEFKAGEYKTIMVYAKKARGLMADWIIQNEIADYNEIKGFNVDGYFYNENLSSENDWIFTR